LRLSFYSIMEALEALLLRYYGGACGTPSAVSWRRVRLSFCGIMEVREALLLQYYGGA
jgi:hypothetical protein